MVAAWYNSWVSGNILVQSKNSSFSLGAIQLCLVGLGKHRGSPECWGFDLQQGFAPNSSGACCIGLFRFICALLRMPFLESDLMSEGSIQAGSLLIKCLFSKSPCFAELVIALSNIFPLKPYFIFFILQLSFVCIIIKYINIHSEFRLLI